MIEDKPERDATNEAPACHVLDRHWSGEPLKDGDTLVDNGRVFRVQLLTPPAPQGPGVKLDQLTLAFNVSGDGSYFKITVSAGEHQFKLKTRAHHYPLLVLARARLADADDHAIHTNDRGWVRQDTLLRQLGYRSNRLHTMFYRARREFEKLGILNAQDLVQRRPGPKLIRIGIAKLAISKHGCD